MLDELCAYMVFIFYSSDILTYIECSRLDSLPYIHVSSRRFGGHFSARSSIHTQETITNKPLQEKYCK